MYTFSGGGTDRQGGRAPPQRSHGQHGGVAGGPLRVTAGHDGPYRLRVGAHRVVYEVRGDRLVILVVTVGNRRDVYRRL
ncbi:type II toxin-antitoxin system RelE/ParE family toxin [Kitasatospora sp. NPDC057692]|uniref:type II toxin-antitoxin system RelE family toxin n=1 Tax=Kitasatospora sp. NPDC057692 TaxID=3346215 RepID=UPI0036B5A5D8